MRLILLSILTAGCIAGYATAEPRHIDTAPKQARAATRPASAEPKNVPHMGMGGGMGAPMVKVPDKLAPEDAKEWQSIAHAAEVGDLHKQIASLEAQVNQCTVMLEEVKLRSRTKAILDQYRVADGETIDVKSGEIKRSTAPPPRLPVVGPMSTDAGAGGKK